MKDYYKHDHTHCFESENPPCGREGKHPCCLCLELPTQTTAETDSDKLRKRFAQQHYEKFQSYNDFHAVLAFIEEELSRQKEKMIEALPEERPAEFYKDASDEMKGEMRGWNEAIKEVKEKLLK